MAEENVWRQRLAWCLSLFSNFLFFLLEVQFEVLRVLLLPDAALFTLLKWLYAQITSTIFFIFVRFDVIFVILREFLLDFRIFLIFVYVVRILVYLFCMILHHHNSIIINCSLLKLRLNQRVFPVELGAIWIGHLLDLASHRSWLVLLGF